MILIAYLVMEYSGKASDFSQAHAIRRTLISCLIVSPIDGDLDLDIKDFIWDYQNCGARPQMTYGMRVEIYKISYQNQGPSIKRANYFLAPAKNTFSSFISKRWQRFMYPFLACVIHCQYLYGSYRAWESEHLLSLF